MDRTPIAGLPLIAESNAAPRIAVNQTFHQLEALALGAVQSRTLTTPPTSPPEGSLYIVTAIATGAWEGQETKVAQWLNGMWYFYSPFVGLRIWSVADNGVIYWNGTAWTTSDGSGVNSVNGDSGDVILDADDIPTTGTINKFVTASDVSKLANVPSDTNTAIAAKENSLGNPTTDGHILSSTVSGVRSWVAPFSFVNISDTNSIDLSGNGSSGSPLSAVVRVDPTSTASVSVTSQGLKIDAETNTASNVGLQGEGVFKQKTGSNLEFKKLVAGTNITLNSTADGITINSTASGGSAIAVSDEGVQLTTNVTSFNFIGSGVTANNSGNIVTLNIPGGLRDLLTANRTYYVSTTGSDTNNGLNVGTAFRTIQKAIDVTSSLDISIYSVTIQISDGIYTQPLELRDCVGGGKIVITGNASNISAVVIDSPNSTSCVGTVGDMTTKYEITNLTINNSGNSSTAIAITNKCTVGLNNIRVGRSTSFCILSQFGANIQVGNITFFTNSSNSGTGIGCYDNATVGMFGNGSYTMTGLETTNTFTRSERGGSVVFVNLTLVGNPSTNGYRVLGHGRVYRFNVSTLAAADFVETASYGYLL